jgi:acyl carrier protein phosphodiesterase
MNYVAHLFLAKPSDEHRIGSLLADFALEASFLAFFPALVDFSAALIGKSE